MDDSALPALIFFFFGSLLFYLIFLLANFAISYSRLARLNDLEDNSPLTVSHAKTIITNRDEYLCATQLALIIISASWSTLALLLLSHGSISIFNSTTTTYGVVVVLATAIAIILLTALLSFFLTQLIKLILREEAELLLCQLGRVIQLLCYPFLQLSRAAIVPARSIMRRFGVEACRHESPASADELSELVELSGEAGILEEQECQMIRSVFSFSDTVGREIMTPRNDVITVNQEASLTEVVETFRQHAVSRLVVIGENLDDVKGVLIAKDLVPLIGKQFSEFSTKSVLRRPCFVRADRKIDTIFQELRKQRAHLAIVLDEHGGVDGIITIEDLVEELVGEILDEHDKPEEELQVLKTKNGDLVVSGTLLIADLNEYFELGLPDGEYDTIAGYVIQQLGRLPKPGDAVSFNQHLIKVESVKKNRIIRLRIVKG